MLMNARVSLKGHAALQGVNAPSYSGRWSEAVPHREHSRSVRRLLGHIDYLLNNGTTRRVD